MFLTILFLFWMCLWRSRSSLSSRSCSFSLSAACFLSLRSLISSISLRCLSFIRCTSSLLLALALGLGASLAFLAGSDLLPSPLAATFGLGAGPLAPSLILSLSLSAEAFALGSEALLPLWALYLLPSPPTLVALPLEAAPTAGEFGLAALARRFAKGLADT